MRLILMLICLVVFTAPGCAFHSARSGDPTIIPSAKLGKLIDQNRERLAGIDSPRHLKHMYLGVDITDQNAFSAFGHVLVAIPVRLYHLASRDTPLKFAALMEDAKSPDNRRDGMMELVQNRFARKDPYTKRYAQIAAQDPEYIVRGAAIRALNHSRSHEATELFVAGIDDTEITVRLEAAKALANIPVEKAIPRLIAHLQKDDSKDVRIACADALRNFKTLDVARALTAVMLDRDFAVSWQARQSLVLMTGRDFRYDEAAWLAYLSKGNESLLQG